MEYHVITAILNGEQRLREEDFQRRQRERNCGDAPQPQARRWQALSAFLARKRVAAPTPIIPRQGMGYKRPV